MSKPIDAADSGLSQSKRFLAVGAAVTIGLALLGQGFTGAAGDELVMPVPAEADSAAVLVTARPVDGECPTFREGALFSVLKRVALGRNFTNGCPYSLTVFAVDHALFVGDPEDEWTEAVEQLHLSALDPALTVPLVIWNGTGKPVDTFQVIATADIKRANHVMRWQRAGLILEREPEIRSFTPRRGYDVNFECSGVGDTLGFTIDSAALNLVYVNHFVDVGRRGETPSYESGYACVRATTPPAVVLLSWDNKNDLTLAHEVGHTLGHSSDEFPTSPRGGHTNNRVGFDGTNLMWTGLIPNPDPRTGVSEGQIFRFHLDRRSWLNRAGLRTLKLQIVCQEEDRDGGLVQERQPPDAEPCLRLAAGEEETP